MKRVSDFWQEQQSIMTYDINDINKFKLWNSVANVPLYDPLAMFEQYKAEIEYLVPLFDKEEQSKWINTKLLKEPFLGHTEESYKEIRRTCFSNTECSTWTLKSAHHLLLFNEMSNKHFNDYANIIEFGAGIGETARLVMDYGFQGNYHIIDLPEVLKISKYYLKDYLKCARMMFIDNIDRLSANIYLPTLFIGTWSFSEIPFEYRNYILDGLSVGDVDWFIIFQNFFYRMRNDRYFFNEFPRISKTWCRYQPLEFHAGSGGNWAMVAEGYLK